MRRVAMVGTIALIVILLSGEPTAQQLAAGLLAVGAWPLYRAIEREGERLFWRRAEEVIASPEPPPTAPLSGAASGSPETPAVPE